MRRAFFVCLLHYIICLPSSPLFLFWCTEVHQWTTNQDDHLSQWLTLILQVHLAKNLPTEGQLVPTVWDTPDRHRSPMLTNGPTRSNNQSLAWCVPILRGTLSGLLSLTQHCQLLICEWWLSHCLLLINGLWMFGSRSLCSTAHPDSSLSSDNPYPCIILSTPAPRTLSHFLHSKPYYCTFLLKFPLLLLHPLHLTPVCCPL